MRTVEEAKHWFQKVSKNVPLGDVFTEISFLTSLAVQDRLLPEVNDDI